MTRRKPRDARLAAARYPVEGSAPVGDGPPNEPEAAGQRTPEQRAQYVEMAIQQAIRRGEFDGLPGAGKPLKNLTQSWDPDWWIRQKIEHEKLTGLGPPALTLRTEDAGLDARLDSAETETEADVRDLLEDFNARVVAARRQLQGGPPVITPTRDIEDEIARWHERRLERRRAAEQAREQDAAARAALTRNHRWRRKRAN